MFYAAVGAEVRGGRTRECAGDGPLPNERGFAEKGSALADVAGGDQPLAATGDWLYREGKGDGLREKGLHGGAGCCEEGCRV